MRERERERERQTDRQTDRQRETETGKYIERRREKETEKGNWLTLEKKIGYVLIDEETEKQFKKKKETMLT